MAKASWSTSPASRTIRLRSPPIARRVNAGLAPPLVHDVVNELSPSKRNRAIVGGYQSLREDLARLSPDRSVPLILIKENVCRLLEARLREDGFNVLNAGRVIYFPSHGRQNDFHRQFGLVLESLRYTKPLSG